MLEFYLDGIANARILTKNCTVQVNNGQFLLGWYQVTWLGTLAPMNFLEGRVP